MHVPCCSQPHGQWRCGNGPLIGVQIAVGHCGCEHQPAAREHLPAAPVGAAHEDRQ